MASQNSQPSQGTESVISASDKSKVKVIFKFCDMQQTMVDGWKDHFQQYIPDQIEVYKGDIFKDGPDADAIVSPANSFGFMDGGIDMIYSLHFGWQMQDRLQKVIREEYNGELLVGQAAIITTVDHHHRNTVDWSKFNGGRPIKYLISAPTMRVPLDVADTVNAYLAFRAVILAVERFNANHPDDPIRSVLCPGLGTAIGLMPRDRCAYQMLKAYETFYLGVDSTILEPEYLAIPTMHHHDMAEYKSDNMRQGPPKNKSVIRVSNKGTTTLKAKYEEKEDETKSTEEQEKPTTDQTTPIEDQVKLTQDPDKVTEDHSKLTKDQGKQTEDQGKQTEDKDKLTEDQGILTEDQGKLKEDLVVSDTRDNC